ncbi:twin-arginine translocase TatA/TatE family subunit [Actinotalea solisilvae]|uniref:twin-arginine translocase TatA/TatE family subunit n=1 Tax=Actinotalea solisilvae TaxID=2072922 RepID=UPI0018F203ED|nr:twin-arginine translocase TatA/TatE family subunit [Actinotalea solisilvae]
MLGINGGEFLVLIVVALLVVGPERLPGYAEQLASWVRTLRRFLGTARERVAEELGEDAADVDWASLDPRRYDPRRIVRDALLEDVAPPPPVTGRRYTSGRGGTAAAAGAARSADARRTDARAEDGPGGGAAGPAPFDDEAT